MTAFAVAGLLGLVASAAAIDSLVYAWLRRRFEARAALSVAVVTAIAALLFFALGRAVD